jgi:two-component system, NarL family, sensor kinase
VFTIAGGDVGRQEHALGVRTVAAWKVSVRTRGPRKRTRQSAPAHLELRDLEERYVALFNAIDQGFCTIEVAFDAQMRPTDYKFLEVSPSFERQTGISNAAGRWMREIEPEHDQHWFDIYGAVALSGQPIRFENYSTPLARWWSVYAFRVGNPRLRHVAILFNDITERKAAERALRSARNELEQRVKERTAEIKGLFAQLVTIQEQERKRIARDIHDQLGQHLTALRLGLESLREIAWPMPALASEARRVGNIAAELDRAIDFLTWDLRPEPLDHLGLSAALEVLVKEWSERFGILAEYGSSGMTASTFPANVQINLYRIAQEALHNIAKHAHATLVTVSLERRENRVQLVIEDNGRGFNHLEPVPLGRLGLVGMRERTDLINGELEIETSPGRGTTVFVRLSTRAATDDEA